jgi:hypothetical protein
MDNSHALIARPSYAVTVLRDADVQRIGAIILSTLDRLGVPGQEFSRIVVYGRRVIAFDLPLLAHDDAEELVTYYALGQRLTQLINPGRFALHKMSSGCALIVDLIAGHQFN